MGISFMIMMCFVWVGFVAAISFMESWLKFRAPGVQLAVGLSIGRLIFKALNRVEWVCFILIILGGFLSSSLLKGYSFLWSPGIIVAAILLIQTAWLLPNMDNRAGRVMKGEKVPKSRFHIYYVGLELIKLALLVYGGIALLRLVN
jgi:hypothetical protein